MKDADIEGKERRTRAQQALSDTADIIKQKPYYSDEAMIKMVNLLYDPMTVALCDEVGISDEAHLLSLTKINNSREAFHWAMQMTKEAALKRRVVLADGEIPGPHERSWPLSKIQRVAFLLARRSIDMKAFMLGVGLAQEQSITKSEEPGEEADW